MSTPISEVPPPLPDLCWPVDVGCDESFNTYPEPVQERAKSLAVQTMHALTGGRVGGCPITIRPCAQRCLDTHWPITMYGQPFTPYSYLGTFYNACGCTSSCACSSLSEVILPGPVGRVDSVTVNGVALATSAYRVDNGNRLVRTDGQAWPACQDMAAPTTAANTFAVTYLNAHPVDGLGAWAAGILASEYAKACMGQKCRLPSGVTDITRQGITMTIASGTFPEGRTGIREVDAYLYMWNPNGLRQQATVWAPGMNRARRTL